MNIEEAIKQLKKHKAEIDKEYISARYSKAIETLLTAYEKEKEKNKELTDEYLVQRDLINPDFLKDYIHKDKIKAKIEELDKDENASIPDFIEYAKEYATQKLQSLLEKE